MTGTDLSDLRERCIRHALTLHPSRTVWRRDPYGTGGGIGPNSETIPPSVDVVLATAEKIFRFCLEWGGGAFVTDRQIGPKRRKHRRTTKQAARK